MTDTDSQLRPSPISLSLVAEIREAVAADLSELLRRESAFEEETADIDDVGRAEPLIWSRLDEMAQQRNREGLPPLPEDEELLIFGRVRADLFGLGGFEEYLRDSTIENIFVNGCDKVFIDRAGAAENEQMPPIAESDDALVQLINRWASRLGRTERRFDVANPRLDLRLPGGYRLHAIMAVTPRPVITIRCPSQHRIDLDGLVERETLTPELADFLEAAVRARLNIIVAGGTGSGKTTLLRALLYECPPGERIITIEDTTELNIGDDEINHPNVVEMETRQANVEGVGDINMMDLTRECLRMSPDRVVIGEVRGAEALYMLKAMSQGNDGSMCTVHAESAQGVADRIRGYCAEGISNIPMSVIDGFYGTAVDLVVHLQVDPTTRRRLVTSIVEVLRTQEEMVRYNELFSPRPGDYPKPTNRPTPELMAKLRHAGMQVNPW